MGFDGHGEVRSRGGGALSGEEEGVCLRPYLTTGCNWYNLNGEIGWE